MSRDDPWESLGIGVPKDDGYPAQTYSRSGVLVNMTDPCEWCGHRLNDVAIDHYLCSVKGMERVMRNLGQRMAEERNARVLRIILGEDQ